MAKKLDIWGNESTMNLENILLVNIQSSPYFKDLYRLKTYHEVVDEIYNEVQVLVIRGTIRVLVVEFIVSCF